MTSDAEPREPETQTPQTAAMLHTCALRLADVVLRYADVSSRPGGTTHTAQLYALNDDIESALHAFNTAAFNHTGTALLLLEPLQAPPDRETRHRTRRADERPA